MALERVPGTLPPHAHPLLWASQRASFPFPLGAEGPARPVEGSGAANILWVPQTGWGHVLPHAGVRSASAQAGQGGISERTLCWRPEEVESAQLL